MRTPACLHPLMAPPLASTIKLTRKLNRAERVSYTISTRTSRIRQAAVTHAYSVLLLAVRQQAGIELCRFRRPRDLLNRE